MADSTGNWFSRAAARGAVRRAVEQAARPGNQSRFDDNGAFWSSPEKEAIVSRGRLAIAPLLEAFGHPQRDARCVAARLLGEMGDASAKSVLSRALLFGPIDLTDHESWVVTAALERLGTSDIVPDICAALRGADRPVRERAIQLLRRFKDARAVEALCGIVENTDEDEWLRLDAVKALGEKGDPRATPALCVALTAPLDFTRGAAASALRMIGDARAIAPLCRLLEKGDQSTNVRIDALYGLGGVLHREIAAGSSADENAVARLFASVSDPDHYVGQAAVGSLRFVGLLSKAEVALLEPLHIYQDNCSERDLRAVEEAIRQGRRVGQPTIDALRTVLRHRVKWLRRHAAALLERSGLPLDPATAAWRAAAAGQWKRVVTLGDLSLEPLQEALTRKVDVGLSYEEKEKEKADNTEDYLGAADALPKLDLGRFTEAGLDSLIAGLKSSSWESYNTRVAEVVAAGLARSIDARRRERAIELILDVIPDPDGNLLAALVADPDKSISLRALRAARAKVQRCTDYDYPLRFMEAFAPHLARAQNTYAGALQEEARAAIAEWKPILRERAFALRGYREGVAAIRALSGLGAFDSAIGADLAKEAAAITDEANREDTSDGGQTMWQTYGDWIDAAQAYARQAGVVWRRSK